MMKIRVACYWLCISFGVLITIGCSEENDEKAPVAEIIISPIPVFDTNCGGEKCL